MTTHQTCQKFKTQTFERPRPFVYFISVELWQVFCNRSSYRLSKCQNLVFEQLKKNTLASLTPPDTSPFPIDFSLDFHRFPRRPTWPHCSAFDVYRLRKTTDLGTPFRIPWAPKCHPKSTKERQRTQTKYKTESSLRFWNWLVTQRPPKPPQGLMFDDLWIWINIY